MTEYAQKVDEREGLEEWSSFLGLRNNVDPAMFGREDLVTATNVDIADDLGISRRKGYSAPVTAAIDRDLWASGAVCLGVGSNTLKQVLPDYTTVSLRTGLSPSRPVSYASVGGRVFYSNSVETGCVQDGTHRTWGITPPGLPVLSAGSGSLRAGQYQVAITYLRSDGQESGTGLAATIELTDTGGIAVSSIPVSTDAGVTHKVIYAASVGGGTLYRSGVITNATTTYLIDEVRKDASPLLTQFLQPPPAGDHIAYWNGRMLVAKDTRLYPSESYAPELFDYRKAVPFLDSILMVAPVKDGVWVGTGSQIIWLTGDSPETWDYKVVAEYGVIAGALTFADDKALGDGSASGDTAAFFASKRGLCIGRVGGSLINFTEARFAYPVQERGAVVVRRHRGMNQMLASLQGAETAGNVAA